MKKLQIYTDGACSGNPGPGGYATVIIENGEEKILSGGEANTTNNRMEMMALIEALKYVHSLKETTEVELFVDSQYVLKGATEWLEGWKRKGWKSTTGAVKNQDLWEEIDQLQKDLMLKWIWVKGHNENKYNEIADKRAVEESAKFVKRR